MLKMILVDNHDERSEALVETLKSADFEIIARFNDADNLDEAVNRLNPDIVIIDTDSPNRDTLENLVVMRANSPRPVVMFAHDNDADKIKLATRAGVCAYIVGDLPATRLKTVMNAAIARFEEFSYLREEIVTANTKLAERKIIERAKGLIMKQKNIDEAEAYQLMRETAMKKNQKLVVLSERIVEAAHLLL